MLWCRPSGAQRDVSLSLFQAEELLGLHSSENQGDLSEGDASDPLPYLGGGVRRRCLTLDPTQYLSKTSCSSGEKIPISSAPVESLSNSNSEMSMRTRMASSTVRWAKLVMNATSNRCAEDCVTGVSISMALMANSSIEKGEQVAGQNQGPPQEFEGH